VRYHSPEFRGGGRASKIGVLSIDIGGGGRGRGTEGQALGEAFDATNSWMSTQRALLLTIALAQK